MSEELKPCQLFDNLKCRDFSKSMGMFGHPYVFNAYVYTFINTQRDNVRMIGRVVQVRKKAGVAGSDRVILRHADGSLCCHENQSFYEVENLDDISMLDKAFSSVVEDSVDDEYTDCDKIPGKGLIVEGQKPSDEVLSFSMTITNNPTKPRS